MAKRVTPKERAEECLAKDCPKCNMPAGTVCFTDGGRPRRTFCKERTFNGKTTVYAEWAWPSFTLDD